MVIRTGIIISSDRGAQGERIDKSGSAIRQALKNKIFVVEGYQIVPDEKKLIQKALRQFTDEQKYDLIVTSGGTGISPRDVTPEATQEVVDRLLPGFAEAMRMHSLSLTPHAMISRAICGTRKQSLIINLPGSPKGAKECLEAVLPAIPHAIIKLKGDSSDCGDHHGF